MSQTKPRTTKQLLHMHTIKLPTYQLQLLIVALQELDEQLSNNTSITTPISEDYNIQPVIHNLALALIEEVDNVPEL